MLKKISRQQAQKGFSIFPSITFRNKKEEYHYPKIFKTYILTIPSKTFKGHSKLMGKNLQSLVEKLKFDSLIFSGDTDFPWLGQTNDYKPVKDAIDFLVKNKIGKKFNGAIQVPLNELPEFISHLSWLTRCNASLPMIYFTDKDQTLLGSICKYGNLHIDTIDKVADGKIKEIIKEGLFIDMTGKNCTNRFGKSSAMRGRVLIVD